jgi:hypothetical protein
MHLRQRFEVEVSPDPEAEFGTSQLEQYHDQDPLPISDIQGAPETGAGEAYCLCACVEEGEGGWRGEIPTSAVASPPAFEPYDA